MRSEETRHKTSILWHNGLLDMFLYRSPKTALKSTQNSPLYSILKLTFPEIFKNESFRFSQFSQNFIFKSFPFNGRRRVEWDPGPSGRALPPEYADSRVVEMDNVHPLKSRPSFVCAVRAISGWLLWFAESPVDVVNFGWEAPTKPQGTKLRVWGPMWNHLTNGWLQWWMVQRVVGDSWNFVNSLAQIQLYFLSPGDLRT